MVEKAGPKGTIGHTGPDGSTMQSRINKFMTWERTIAENIMYNSMTPLECLISLAIDDGVPSRGHRTNIMNRNLAYMGAATGMHQRFGSMTVTDYSGSNRPTGF